MHRYVSRVPLRSISDSLYLSKSSVYDQKNLVRKLESLRTFTTSRGLDLHLQITIASGMEENQLPGSCRCKLLMHFAQTREAGASSLLSELGRGNYSLRADDFIYILEHCSKSPDPLFVMEIWRIMDEKEVHVNNRCYMLSIQALCKGGYLEEAFNLLNFVGENHDIHPILPMYNNFLRGCVQTRSLLHANQCLDLMEHQVLGKNEVTYSQFLKVNGFFSGFKKELTRNLNLILDQSFHFMVGISYLWIRVYLLCWEIADIICLWLAYIELFGRPLKPSSSGKGLELRDLESAYAALQHMVDLVFKGSIFINKSAEGRLCSSRLDIPIPKNGDMGLKRCMEENEHSLPSVSDNSKKIDSHASNVEDSTIFYMGSKEDKGFGINMLEKYKGMPVMKVLRWSFSDVIYACAQTQNCGLAEQLILQAIRNGWENIRTHSRFIVGDVNKEGWVADAWEEDGVRGSWGLRFNRHLNDWENKNGTFSVKSFYGSFSRGIRPPFPTRIIWTPWVPTGASFFGWETAWNRLLTIDRLKRSGWNIPNRLVSYQVRDMLVALLSFVFCSLMQNLGLEPSCHTYDGLIKAIVSDRGFSDGMEVLKTMQLRNLKPYDSTLAALSIGSSKALQLDLAESLLDQISRISYVHPFNAFLAACDTLDQPERAVPILSKMKQLKLQPNVGTYELLFSLFGNVNAPYEEGNMLSQVDVARRIKAIEMDMMNNGIQHSHLSMKNLRGDVALTKNGKDGDGPCPKRNASSAVAGGDTEGSGGVVIGAGHDDCCSTRRSCRMDPWSWGTQWGGMVSDETRQGRNGEWRGSRRVVMPVFTGENPDGWIFWADRYFATYGLTKEEKLVAAAMSLDGDALSWYQWTDSREAFGSWDNLKRRLLLRFRPTQEGSLCEQFLAVRQQGTVAAYRREFEILATPLKGILEKVMESTFMNGLLPEIRLSYVFCNYMGWAT
ncbi:Pentatricopeptide repeat-containing protein [Vitis vinifera]|uniref:Pentatricopeptide repeat-containing protein n=1 Tax=Vitis vinifera TaxID=29760 RepID=A0A438K401_VITVI|nr:Pentatricopeptide repeat-containing protein [Vitis vinifera]